LKAYLLLAGKINISNSSQSKMDQEVLLAGLRSSMPIKEQLTKELLYIGWLQVSNSSQTIADQKIAQCFPDAVARLGPS